jgi:endo-1,4-beta-xylanase
MSTSRELSTHRRRRARARAAHTALFAVLAAIGCSTGDDSQSTADDSAGTGGASSALGSGGAVAAGGSGGSAGVHGGSGGAGSGGSAASGTGGKPGGALGSGGGGSVGTGGAPAQGMGTGGSGPSMQDAGAEGGDAAVDAGTSGPLKKFVGNITTKGAVRDGFAMNWDQITPENEGKWASVQPSQGSFNWTALDKIYAYAQTNHIVFKEHCFVWGNQQPSWVNSGNAETAVKAWMKAFCERYPETKLIDVVNEPPPHTTPGYIGGMGGAGTSGYDWIVNAFKWAREACPNAILILNDYNTIEYQNDNSHFIDIVNKVKAAGAPIDAIGAQAHAAHSMQTSTVKGYLDKLAATGLPVYITEYDIDVADDNQQKMIMQDQMTMFWNDDDVKGITLWGYIVGSTWQTNSGLQQQNGTMRPAMTWLMDFLGR